MLECLRKPGAVRNFSSPPSNAFGGPLFANTDRSGCFTSSIASSSERMTFSIENRVQGVYVTFSRFCARTISHI